MDRVPSPRLPIFERRDGVKTRKSVGDLYCPCIILRSSALYQYQMTALNVSFSTLLCCKLKVILHGTLTGRESNCTGAVCRGKYYGNSMPKAVLLKADLLLNWFSNASSQV